MMAISFLPEEFPVVLTFLALGAWRISRKNVLTRASTAVEALGSATVLRVDNTGTITQNQMAARKLFVNGQSYVVDNARQGNFPEQFHKLVEFGMLANAGLSIPWIWPSTTGGERYFGGVGRRSFTTGLS